MGVLPRVKVQFVHHILVAGVNHGYAQSLCEAGFEINAAPGTFVSVRKIRHQKPGAANFGDDFVVNLVDVRFPGRFSTACTLPPR